MPQGPTAGEETRAWAFALVTRHIHRARGLRVPCPLRPLYTLRGAWRRCVVTAHTAMMGAGRTRWTRRLARPRVAFGSIWQQYGAATLPQLQRGTTLPERLVHMGVGWLAREGKLGFVQERGVLKLALHPSSGPPA